MTENFPHSAEGGALEAKNAEALQETLDRMRLEIAELRASRRRLVLAADASRRRIERELHDGVQQHLVALAMRLQLASEAVENDPSLLAALLAEVANDVQETIDEAARLAQRILPPALDSGGLTAALRSWALSAGMRATIEVRMGQAVPAETIEALYFCCLAALELVGGGAVATITVHDEAGLLAFEVVGNRPESVASAASDATLELSDRIDALDGQLAIRSEPDGSTMVSGSIPTARSSQPFSAR
jgi:signal transduction histidine kinase